MIRFVGTRGRRVKEERGEKGRGVLVSILSEPRISEFEFVPLSADSIVIAYLRGGWPRGQAISTYFMRRDPGSAHGKTRVYSRFLACFRHAKPSLRGRLSPVGNRIHVPPLFFLLSASWRTLLPSSPSSHPATQASSSRP